MALNATIFKAELQVADMDRNYYRDHTLTLARHPSETDERMMLRLLAFVWWNQVGGQIRRAVNLTVIDVPVPSSQAIARLARRSMQLQCTIQDGQVWLTDGQNMAHAEPVTCIISGSVLDSHRQRRT